MSVLTQSTPSGSPSSSDFDPTRPFVVVQQATGLISMSAHDVTCWQQAAIDRLFDMVQHGFFQTVAVDVAVALPVSYKRLCEALYREHWINRAGKLVIHGMHSPCGDLQQHTILPDGHAEAKWLPTIEVVSMTYTDSLPVHNYQEACEIGFANLRQGRCLVEPFTLG